MLYSMGHTGHVIVVQEVPNLHIHGCAGLIGSGVMDQKSLELIWKADHSIRAIIEFWLFQSVGQPF